MPNEAQDLKARARAELQRRRLAQQSMPVQTQDQEAAPVLDIRERARQELAKRKQIAVEPVQAAEPANVGAPPTPVTQQEAPTPPQAPTPPSSPQATEEDPGFFSNLKTGSKMGAADVERQYKILGALLAGEQPEGIPIEQSAELDLSRKGIGQFLGRTFTGGAPTLGAGVTGGAIGAAAGTAVPVVGNVIGGLAGSAAGAGSMGALQSYADAYNEARLSGADHEKSLEYAGKVAKISGGINAVAGLAGGIGIKDALLKHALKQIPLQTGLANVENIARNVTAKEEGIDPERDILAGTKEATFGPGLMHTVQAGATKLITGGKKATAETAQKPQQITKETLPAVLDVSVGKQKLRYNNETQTWETSTPAKKPEVPRGTVTEKPHLRYDPETKTWKPSKKKDASVVSAEETNLGRKTNVTEAQKSAADVNLDDVHQKIYGGEKPKTSFIDKMVEKTKAFRRKHLSERGMFDMDAPIKHLEAKSGIKTPGEGTAYKATRFSRHSSGSIDAALEHGRPYWDKALNIMRVNTNAPGLTTIFKSVAKTPKMFKDFQTYAYARRVKSQNLIERGKEQNIRPHEVEAAIKLEEAHPEFKQAFDEIQEYNKSVLDILEDTGLISADKRADWEGIDYVPFYRDLGERLGVMPATTSNKLAGQKTHIKELKGKHKMYQVLDENGKEISRVSSKELAENIADQHGMQMSDENVGHVTKDIAENLYKNVSSFIPAAMKNVAANLTIQKALKKGIAEPISAKKARNIRGDLNPNVVTVMEDGKPKNYLIKDPELYSTLAEGTPKEPGIIRKIGKISKGLFSTAIVSNPKIAIGIIAKDIIQSGLVGKYSMRNIVGIVKDLPKELVKAYAHEFGIKKDQRQIDISAMGADSRYFSAQAKRRELDRWIAKNNGQVIPNDWYYFPDKIRKLVDKILTPAESANKMRKFEAARRAGKDLATSGYEALDYMDYQKQGSGEGVQWLRDFVPFAGSHLSSTHTLGTELAHNKGMNRTTARLATLAAFSGYNAIVNLDESNDPDPSNGYMALPDYVRDNNWCIDTYKLPNGIGMQRFEDKENRWLMIPKPWEAGQLGGSVVENLIAAYKGEEDSKDLYNYMLKQFNDYLTINPAGNPIIKTIYEQWANKQSFLNQPIVPKRTQNLAPELQYGPKTSETAKRIGEATNTSPARIEHAANGILGSLAEYIFALGDIMINDKSEGEKPDKKTSDKYIFNKFVKDTPLERTSYESEMYELYHATQEAYNTLQAYQKMEEPEKAEKYSEKNQQTLMIGSYVEGVRKQVKELDDQRMLIRKDPELTGAQKKEAIDDVLRAKNELLREMHQNVKEMKKEAEK